MAGSARGAGVVMLWYWYFAYPHELLIDLDHVTDKKLAAFGARLAGAIETGTLPVLGLRITPSTTDEHVHAYVRVSRDLKLVERTAWELYLLSDRHRAACNLARSWRADAAPSLLIEPFPIPNWRAHDEMCACPAKHTPEVMELCPVGSELGRVTTDELFSPPNVSEAMAVVRGGLTDGAGGMVQ